MSEKTPHVRWWTAQITVDCGRGKPGVRETHGELHLDDLDAELFYPEPGYHPERGALYLCGYVRICAANSENSEVPRCAACVARLPWAKQEGDRLVAEYRARVTSIERAKAAMTDPSTSLESLERAELARLLEKYRPEKPENIP